MDASVFRLLGEAEQLMRESRRQQLDTLPRHLGQLQVVLAQGRRAFAGLELADLDGVGLDLSDCDLRGSCLRAGRLGQVILRGAQLGGSSLQQALLWGADLSKTQAQASLWHEADLSGARLKGADFSEALLHRCCLRGMLAAGSHWRRARLVEADFRSGLDQLTDLGGADFREADLSFALFQAAQMAEADLRGSCLYGANLAGADLTGANLEGCDL